MGPITTAISNEFFAIVNGKKPDIYGWLTPVRVPVGETVGV
jgi:branched-chain amino acid aminotransferase